jgi:hypothetical protein
MAGKLYKDTPLTVSRDSFGNAISQAGNVGDTAKDKKDRPPLSAFGSPTGTTTPAASPAQPAGNNTTKFIRSKGTRNNYIYTPSPRGLTMDEWRANDAR